MLIFKYYNNKAKTIHAMFVLHINKISVIYLRYEMDKI